MAGAAFWGSGVDGPTTFSNGAGDKLRTINQTYSDHPWDIAYIAGRPLPGECEVLDGLTEIGIDNKNPDGKDGSAITVKGYRPGPFIIACTVWTLEQWDALQDIVARVWRRPNKKAKVADVAVSVHHPALEMYGIGSAVLTGCTMARNGRFDGAKTVHFKFLENVPAGSKGKRQTKTAGQNHALPQIKDAQRPANAPPLPPSKNRGQLGPGGPKTVPASGGP